MLAFISLNSLFLAYNNEFIKISEFLLVKEKTGPHESEFNNVVMSTCVIKKYGGTSPLRLRPTRL